MDVFDIGVTEMDRLRTPGFEDSQQRKATLMTAFKQSLIQKCQISDLQYEIIIRQFQIEDVLERTGSLPKTLLSDIVRYTKVHFTHDYGHPSSTLRTNPLEAEEQRRMELLREYKKTMVPSSKPLAQPSPAIPAFEPPIPTASFTDVPRPSSPTSPSSPPLPPPSFLWETTPLSQIVRPVSPSPSPTVLERMVVYQGTQCNEQNDMIVLPIKGAIRQITEVSIRSIQLRGDHGVQDHEYVYMKMEGEPTTVYYQNGTPAGCSVWKWSEHDRECIPVFHRTIRWESSRDLDRIGYQLMKEDGTRIDKNKQYLHVIFTYIPIPFSTD